MSPRSTTRAAARNLDRRIEASIKLIESALEKGVREGDVAAGVGLGRSRFGHLFRAYTGTTFRRYVKSRRLARAKALLRDLSLRVEEVGWQCGYAHASTVRP